MRCDVFHEYFNCFGNNNSLLVRLFRTQTNKCLYRCSAMNEKIVSSSHTHSKSRAGKLCMMLQHHAIKDAKGNLHNFITRSGAANQIRPCSLKNSHTFSKIWTGMRCVSQILDMVHLIHRGIVPSLSNQKYQQFFFKPFDFQSIFQSQHSLCLQLTRHDWPCSDPR